MSYTHVTQEMYQSGQPSTPWHQGDTGWTAAPIPSWGTNPNLVGPNRVGMGTVPPALFGFAAVAGLMGLAAVIVLWGQGQKKKDLAELRRGFKGNRRKHQRRNAQHVFPPGARVLIDGIDEAKVRQAFPEGSSSYMWPHYKVDFIGGDKNVAVAMSKVGVERRKR